MMFDSAAFLKTLPARPGVYRMCDGEGEILYVGKAGNLKKRVASYFRNTGLSQKTLTLVEQIASIEVTVTHTEGEALLLESNLIKQFRPKYNVLLRDDKSYPWIYLSNQQDFPRLAFHRGARRAPGQYFGPFPGAGAVRDSLQLLQKLFKVRQCEDVFFNNRSRPCLQYQIGRCTAPCVGLVSREEYRRNVERTALFLEGQGGAVVDDLVGCMNRAAEHRDYEQAAMYRDQIASLQQVQEKQYISRTHGDTDILACASANGVACIQVFFVRGGRNLGNTAYFPKVPLESTPGEVLEAFIPQYYLRREIPAEILLSHTPPGVSLLQEVLGGQSGRKVRLRAQVRGDRARWVKMAGENALHALTVRLNAGKGYSSRLQALADALCLDDLPGRIECFDISHTAGESTVASCVVFGPEGPLKSDYRRFNIRDIEAGDDYAAMTQALTRRYTRLRKGEGKMPDLLLVDGGRGQLNVASRVLEELQIPELRILGVAKGPGRKPGLETIYQPGSDAPLALSPDSPALLLIQQIRDEAHRFAITGHRQRRARSRSSSPLQNIPGIGAKRRQMLLQQMGGIREVARAGVEDLARIKGINRALAQQIYDAFHNE